MPKLSNKMYYGGLGAVVLLTVVAILYQQEIQKENSIYFPRPLTEQDLKLYSNHDAKAIIIYPIFTQFAYKDKGFYDYYKGTCKTCNTITMTPNLVNASYVTGKNTFDYLRQLNYSYITDIDVDKNPDILKKYDKIILLHNEYVTQKEFDAILSHKNVLYLLPNSLYVKISVDYQSNTISLVRGHGIDNEKGNGFGFVTTSAHEYDLNCKNYKWEPRPNGIEPTCWTDFLIKSDRNYLKTITDYPGIIPPLVTIENNLNLSSVPNCTYYGYCTNSTSQNP